jgi:hypothetical protein
MADGTAPGSLTCPNCNHVNSTFDVHCGGCRSRLEAPPVELQIENLGLDRVDQTLAEQQTTYRGVVNGTGRGITLIA